MTYPRPTHRSSGASSPGIARGPVHVDAQAPTTRMQPVNRASNPYPPLYEDEDEPETRLPTSARRYHAGSPVVHSTRAMNVVIHRRASRPRSRETEPVPAVPQGEEDEEQAPRRWSFWRRFHPSFYVGSAMCATLGLVIGGQAVMTTLQRTRDDWTYERPRIAQIDARVGHNDTQTPTHFMVLNLNRQLYVFECPGGDCTKGHVYPGPALVGAGTELAPATIAVEDVTGDGKPDLVIRVQESIFVLVNDHGTFRPARPTDHVIV